MRIILAAIFALFSISVAVASTTIDAQAVRNQTGSGSTLISSGFPLPPGLVTETMVANRAVKVILNGTEVAANVSPLRGRHRDETIRSILIQFSASLTQGVPVTAQVIVDGGVRSLPDPAYQRPTLATVQNNNVILPTDPDYITTTLVTFQHLLPAGDGTAEEEKQYTTLAETAFDALVVSGTTGAANYEEVRGMATLWARTGDIKYFNHAVTYIQTWLTYNTPGKYYRDDGVHACRSDAYVNPDGRTPTQWECGEVAEPNFSRTYSYATMYLLTGFRDFWSIVAYQAQSQDQRSITSQEEANTLVVPYSGFDGIRTNYALTYGALLAAYMIDATAPVPGRIWAPGRQFDWTNQLPWTLNAIKSQEWNFQWIPYNNGSGNPPAVGTAITQAGVTGATFMGAFAQMHDPIVFPENTIPATGYIMVSVPTSGAFSAGALTGISATATGGSIPDYRMGMTGTRPNSIRRYGSLPYALPIFQLIFPTNFLIDYYLNVQADSRIPAMVKKNLDIFLQNVKPLVPGDHAYGDVNPTWGSKVWGTGYPLENPVDTGIASADVLAEFPRMVAFVLKTLGNDTVNGADYTTWYSRIIDTANNYGLAGAQWKLFGQFYGFGSDAPWIMAQTSLSGPSNIRVPYNYSAIPGDAPDVEGNRGRRLSLAGRPIKLAEPGP